MLGPTDDIADIRETLGWMAKVSHSGLAIWGGAIVDSFLADLIAANMPNLSNRMRTKLFEGYGPLGSFAAKIDLAYCMGHIPSELRRRLQAIRDIRNEFAHSTKLLNFESDTILAMMKKFPDYKSERPHLFFLDKVNECTVELGQLTDQAHRVMILRRRTMAKPDSSSEKSE